ncbi:MAG TPA: pyridine nucleotide-disulfide oxidoreductase, partial [Stellaceae bacterium]|nr:pyridine nucleotide-disulfide oxidoreductase [Stellaceae bacterium]
MAYERPVDYLPGMTELALKHGLSFGDLYERDGLIRLDRAFVAHLAAAEVALHDRLMAARAAPDGLDRKAESDLLVDLAPHLEDFIGELFGIASEVCALQAAHDKLAPLSSVKRLFVQRRAVKEVKEADALHLNGHRLAQELETLIGGPPKDKAGDFATRDGVLAWELRYAEAVARWLDDEAAHHLALRIALEYAAWATLSPDGRARHKRGLLFRVPHRLDMHHLVPVETIERHGVMMLRRPEAEWRARDGFQLTDPGTDLAGAEDEANYCIWCHNQQKD